MKKRLLCLLSVLLIGALMLCSVGCLEESKKEESKQDWKWYENKEKGYKIKYPASWNILPWGGFASFYEPGKPIPRGIFITPTFALSEERWEEIEYGRIAHIEYIKKSQEEGKKIKIVELSDYTLDGHPAKKLVTIEEPEIPPFLKEELENQPPYKGVSIFTAVGKFRCEIEYFAALEDFDDAQPIFKEMLDSFKFI